jgi:hypothetical protein
MTVYTRLCTQIGEQLRQINARLSKLEEVILNQQTEPVDIPESRLLSISDHLRKTFIAVTKLGISNAKDISIETGRARAIESHYLNQLVTLGWLMKTREGRECQFTVKVNRK